MSRQYITTAIDYPNAAPHMGHVLEKVLADVVARWLRLSGHEVRFQTGTDEHGIKIQRKAEEEGISPQELVNKNAVLFKELYDKLGISYDIFFRTSNKQAHYPTVSALWNQLIKAGVLEKRTYTGLYCSGCERFLTKRDLTNGLCPDHKKAPEEVTEENWFLRLSNDTKNLKNLLTSNWDNESYRIIPSFRAQETLSLIEQGLEDVSFSRPKSSLYWGVPVPGEESEQTMYVWCDALTNYISGLGLLTENAQEQWWNDAVVTHVIGKDIARFHALIWPDMLKHAGIKTPDQLLTHGFLTSEGQKMSKSIGNVVVPAEVLEYSKDNPDPIRFYLSHEVPVGRDGDFSWDRFKKLYNAVLRNDIGNLLNRVLVLLNKIDANLEKDIPPVLLNHWPEYEQHMNAFKFDEAVKLAVELANRSNKFIDEQKPWALEENQKRIVLTQLAENLRHISLMLLPFIPHTAQRIATQLNVPYASQMLKNNFVISSEMKQWNSQDNWNSVNKPEILFQPLE